MDILTIPVENANLALDVLKTSVKREILLLEKSLEKAERKLKGFEERQHLKSSEFYDKFSRGEMGDEQDVMLWAAEYEAYKMLDEERHVAKGILLNFI